MLPNPTTSRALVLSSQFMQMVPKFRELIIKSCLHKHLVRLTQTKWLLSLENQFQQNLNSITAPESRPFSQI